MYQLLSKQRVKPASICIKIPATLGGLKACAELQKKGVRTLATTVFTVEQGLAAAEAAGCAVSLALGSSRSMLMQLSCHISTSLHTSMLSQLISSELTY